MTILVFVILLLGPTLYTFLAHKYNTVKIFRTPIMDLIILGAVVVTMVLYPDFWIAYGLYVGIGILILIYVIRKVIKWIKRRSKKKADTTPTQS